MSRPEYQRNLLYGLVAVLHGIISEEQLRQVLAGNATADGTTLAVVLQRTGAMTPEAAQWLQSLVDLHLQRHGGDAAASVAELQAASRGLADFRPPAPAVPDTATLTQATADFCRAATNAATVGASGSLSRLELAGARPDPEQTARFSIIRFHSRGNLGKVSLAKDRELPREVAVKQIREDHANLPGHRAHFLLEAEITGGLEHPNIVPVYGLGIDAAGAPFYAMKFIKGESFRTAIQRYHHRRRRAAARRGVVRRLGRRWLRHPLRNLPSLQHLLRAAVRSKSLPASFDLLGLQQLLSRFHDVCLALEYAHRRHVIHRDIKPENIMLGKYGETLVVDWGLAKTIGMPNEREAVPPGKAEETVLIPPSASSTAPEQEGARIGTPAYMAPEQAAGKISQLGPYSDIYALGGLLYVILTGERAFRGKGKEEIMALVREGRFDRPRARCPAVPRPLEAVCLKAMARQPQDRYASARALAEDIDRWLAGERLTAWTADWPEPRWDRFLRWVRKRQKLTTAFVSAVTVGLVLSIVLGWQIAQQKRQAEHNFWMAKNAIDQYFTSASESTLLNEPGLLPLRRELLQQARNHYQHLLTVHADSDFVRRDEAATRFRLGRVCESMGEWTEALDEYQAALQRQQQEWATANHDPEGQSACGRTWNAIGRVHQHLLQWDQADAAYRQALKHRRAALQAAHPDRTAEDTGELQRELANSLMNLAQLRLRAHHANQVAFTSEDRQFVHQWLVEAQRLRDAALADNLHQPRVQRDKAMGLFQWGEWELTAPHLSRINLQAATMRFQAGVELVQNLLVAAPQDLELQLLSGKFARRLADCHYEQAMHSGDPSDLAQAVESYGRAEREIKPQVDRNPLALPYRHLLAGAFLAHGRCLLLQAEQDEVGSQTWQDSMSLAYEKLYHAADLLQGLVGHPEATPEMLLDYASSLTTLAIYHLHAAQLDEALGRAEQALARLQELPADYQAHPAWSLHRQRALLAQADARWLIHEELTDPTHRAANEQTARTLLDEACQAWEDPRQAARHAPELAFLAAGALRRQAEWQLAGPAPDLASAAALLERAQAMLEESVAAAGAIPLQWRELETVNTLLQQLDSTP